MLGKKIAFTFALSTLAATLIGATVSPATASATPAAPAVAGSDVSIQTIHKVCADTLLLRTQPGGNVYIGTLYNNDTVNYQYSITGWSYVYAYRYSRYGWIQSGWLC